MTSVHQTKPRDSRAARPGVHPPASPAPFFDWLEQPTPAVSWLEKAGPIVRRMLAEQGDS